MQWIAQEEIFAVVPGGMAVELGLATALQGRVLGLSGRTSGSKIPGDAMKAKEGSHVQRSFAGGVLAVVLHRGPKCRLPSMVSWRTRSLLSGF